MIDQVNLSDIALTGHDGILVTVWLGISIMVFSFNFSPIVSSFVVSKRRKYEAQFGREYTERKCSQIISRASMLMVAVVMILSPSAACLPSHRRTWRTPRRRISRYSPIWRTTLPRCRAPNHAATLLEYGASIIALVAIFKSFFGHYLGTLEGLNGLILRFRL